MFFGMISFTVYNFDIVTWFYNFLKKKSTSFQVQNINKNNINSNLNLKLFP